MQILTKLRTMLGARDKTPSPRDKTPMPSDISTPAGRRRARLDYYAFDHAVLRILWTNFWPVAPGVWRSNQPTAARFARYKAMGIRTVINLRGETTQAPYLFEKEACDALGLTLINVRLWARTAAPRRRIVAVLDALRAAEKPMDFHCKSGADRAGFVAALYQIVFEGVPVAEARKQLGLKYVHLEFTRTGVQGYILDTYAARAAQRPIGFEDWLRTEYDHRALQQCYDARRAPAETARVLAAAVLPGPAADGAGSGSA